LTEFETSAPRAKKQVTIRNVDSSTKSSKENPIPKSLEEILDGSYAEERNQTTLTD
jgi:hypothetical protein